MASRRARCPRRTRAARAVSATPAGLPWHAALTGLRLLRGGLLDEASPDRPSTEPDGGAASGVPPPRAAITDARDGYLRLTWPRLLDTQFSHLFSGLDAELEPGMGASASTICGYTEWISHAEPVVSLGWDWQLNVLTGMLEPSTWAVRSNLMLIGQDCSDLGVRATERLLGQRLRTLDWQATVASAVGLQQQ